MTSKMLAALAAATTMLAAGAAHAQDYGTPPYAGSGAYGYGGYSGASCGGFTIAGVRAGVTVLGFDLGAGTRFSFGGGGCGGGYAPAAASSYAPPQPQASGGGYYNQAGGGYPPAPYAYQQQYAAPAYSYGGGAPCGCQGAGAYQSVAYQPY
jgi:hypothetical protein